MHKYHEFKECSGNTDIFIYPGFEFQAIDGLITNFHLPKSTLLMLVSALSSREIILHAYKIAVNEKYRFFSFGDSMDMIVIGSIVPLLPGVPLTNSIRDYLNGDYLSGTIRMIDAVLVACCIALGVGIVLRVFQMVTAN